MLIKKLNLLPSYQKHILSLIISVLCMTAATGLSCILHKVAGESSVNTTLIFILFLLVASCCTSGYWYGIVCCLFTVLYFFRQNLIFNAIVFIPMLAITVLVSTLASHLKVQADLIAGMEKQLSGAGMEKARTNLLLAISHDLRTPLTGIIGSCAAFLENQPHLSEREKTDIVTNIYEDSNWLIKMVENLLYVTRLQNYSLCISTSEEAIEEVVAEALQKMNKRHPECTIHVQIPDEFIMLPMDAILIEQVIINLLENALYHAKSAEPVDLIVEDTGKEVSFTVRDYGAGIPGEKLAALFDGMTHTDPCSTDPRKGMGIGLTLCKTIITAHHGTLTGKNHPRGAEFTFTLPRTKEKTLSDRKEVYSYEYKNQHFAYRR